MEHFGYLCKYIIIIKITWHIELGKETPYKPEQPQNHDTRQAIEQQKETEIMKKYKLSPL